MPGATTVILPEGRCKGFQCFSGACLSSSLQQDGISDCPGLSQEDEEAGVTGQSKLSEIPTLSLDYVLITLRHGVCKFS